MDWVSRCVLSWELSNTLDSEFCVQALEAAMAAHPAPDIFNTVQGSQFRAGVHGLLGGRWRANLDGRPGALHGRCMDNIFIERLWRSLKYEAVHLQELTDGFGARRQIGRWMRFYNRERPHSAPGGRTPWETLQGHGRAAWRRGRD